MIRKTEYLCVFLTGGILYSLIEMLWRGYTHWSMTIAGGTALLLIHILNQKMRERDILLRCLYGCLLITVVELAAGIIVNLWLGLDVSRDGYSYLCAAIAYRMEHPRHLLTKEVYPAVAKCFNCSGGQVEKSISRVIEAAWKCRDDAVWREFFPTEPGGIPKRPTNDKFIARMAVFLESRRLGRLENAAEHRQVPEKIGNYVDITNEK